jgi:hypothetical protein
MERELPIDLMEFVEEIKTIIEDGLDWAKCDSKLAWTMSAFKTGEEKEKAAVTLNYQVKSAHPNVKDALYNLSIKVNLDRIIELSFDGLYFDDLFDVSAKVHLSESDIKNIPFLIGKYLDLKTSSTTPIVKGVFED